MGTILAFVDGVGAGVRDPATNPLARRDTLLSFFADGAAPALPRGGVGRLVDACLGVPGRPQSATGQTTILTGVNAPVRLGRHLLGFPNPALRQLLAEHSLFKALSSAGRAGAFANAYPTGYLDALGLPFRPTDPPEPPLELPPQLRASATTLAASAGGVYLRNFDDLRRGEAITHDLTARRGRSRGFHLPERTPEEAAEAVLRLAAAHDFTLCEHFLLDELGHLRDAIAVDAVLLEYDRFLRALVAGLPAGAHLFVVSDHGNVEDLSVRSHTLNPVPLLAFGPRAQALSQRVQSLVDVRPALLASLGLEDAQVPGETR